MKKKYICITFVSIVGAAILILIGAFGLFSKAEPSLNEPPSSVVSRETLDTSSFDDVFEINADTTYCKETSVDIPTEPVETATSEPESDWNSEYDEQDNNFPCDTESYYVEVVPTSEPESDLDVLIYAIAAEYNLPWQLVKAVCWVESSFDPYAVSDTYDYGLMQVSYIVWNSLGIDPTDENVTIQFDPETNLRVGCNVLSDKLNISNGNVTAALMRYRFGDGGAMSYWSMGIYCNWYTDAVLTKYYEYIK